MDNIKLIRGNKLKAELDALKRVAAINPQHRDNPEITFNKGMDNSISLPTTLSRRIINFLEKELAYVQKEFDEL